MEGTKRHEIKKNQKRSKDWEIKKIELRKLWGTMEKIVFKWQYIHTTTEEREKW